MDYDLMFVIRAVLIAIAIPSVLAAHAQDRAPWVAVLVSALGTGLVAYALLNLPDPHGLADLPDIFYRVIGRYLH